MPKGPTAALLIIGAEVLSGKVDDANGPYLLRALRLRGVALQEIRTIGDDIDAIAEAVRALSPHVDDVYSTGGIGPTHDDVTIAGMARAFDRAVVHHPDLLSLLTTRYKGSMNAARLKMAEVPEGASLILGRWARRAGGQSRKRHDLARRAFVDARVFSTIAACPSGSSLRLPGTAVGCL